MLLSIFFSHVTLGMLLIYLSPHISISDLLDVDGSLTDPMRVDEVMKWSGAALGRLKVLTVFSELPGLTGSRSSGLIKASETGSCADSDEGFLSVLAGAVLL